FGVEPDAAKGLRVRNANLTAHRHASGPAAIAQIWPIIDAAARDKDDVLRAIAGHVRELYPRIAELDVREAVEFAATAGFDPVPAELAVVEKELELGAGAQRVGRAVAIEIEQANFRIV